MLAEVTPQIAGLYSAYVQQQNVERAKRKEVEQRKSRVHQIFTQGIDIANEYGNVVGTFARGFGGSDISVTTHPVTLKVGGEEVDFVVKAESWSPSHDEPQLPLSNYRSISIYPLMESGFIDHPSNPLFKITSEGQLFTQFEKDNDPEAIQAASDLINAIRVAFQ